MAVNVTVLTRCTSKTLTTLMPPGGQGNQPVDAISLVLQLQQATDGTTGTVSIVIPLTSDTFAVGSYYNVVITDGVAPTRESV